MTGFGYAGRPGADGGGRRAHILTSAWPDLTSVFDQLCCQRLLTSFFFTNAFDQRVFDQRLLISVFGQRLLTVVFTDDFDQCARFDQRRCPAQRLAGSV